MKTYSTPQLEVKGSIVALTQGGILGTNDPDEVTGRIPAGSIGFGL